MGSTFFEEFLYVTNVIRTGGFIVALIGLFIFMWYLGRKEVLSLSGRMLVATLIGLLLGLAILLVADFPEAPLDVRFVSEVRTWYGLVADGFMSLLRMLVVPLVLVSIIRVIAGAEQGSSLSKLTFRTVGILIATTVTAATIGLLLSRFFNLGVGTELVYGTDEIREISTIVDTFLNLIPANPFEAMSTSAIIPIIVFASFVGVAIRMQRRKDEQVVKPFIDFIEATYSIIMNMAKVVIGWMPYAIIALLANTMASRGLQVFEEVFSFTMIFILSCTLMFVVHLLILTASGMNPFMYMKNVSQALILAFNSRSSLGTLPVSIESLTRNAGLNQGTATFAASLGANGGMNGSAGIYSAMVTVMIANMVGHPIDITFILMLLLVISLSSFGIAGIPGAITLTISITLSAVGLGEHFPLMAAVIAIDPVLDMFRTFTNVSGALTTSLVVGKSLGQVDLDVYSAKNEKV